jgi:DNA-binding CsgD family transcriptional regulator
MADEDLELARETGDQWGLGYALHMVAQIALDQSQYSRTLAFSQEAEKVWRELGDDRGLAHELVQLSIALRREGEAQRALALGREALVLFHHVGDTWGIVGALVVVAAAAERLDRAATAVRILAAEDAFARTIGIALVIPHWQRDFESTLDACHESLEPSDFDAAWTAGRTMPIEQAIGHALSDDSAVLNVEVMPPGREALVRLTARERQVAALIAGGLTDQQIADALVISRRTAENHVYHVLLKLGFHSRSDLVDWAPRMGLRI